MKRFNATLIVLIVAAIMTRGASAQFNCVYDQTGVMRSCTGPTQTYSTYIPYDETTKINVEKAWETIQEAMALLGVWLMILTVCNAIIRFEAMKRGEQDDIQ